MPDVLNKAIIGNDEFFVIDGNSASEETYIYYSVDEKGNCTISIADMTDSWFSLVRTKSL